MVIRLIGHSQFLNRKYITWEPQNSFIEDAE